MLTSGTHNIDPYSESAECPTTSTASLQSSHIQQRCNVRSPIITRLAASRARQTSTLESGSEGGAQVVGLVCLMLLEISNQCFQSSQLPSYINWLVKM